MILHLRVHLRTNVILFIKIRFFDCLPLTFNIIKMRLPHSITCIFFFSFILQHCLFTMVVFDDDNRGRKPKWFVVNQMIPFRWPSRSLEWGYVLISQFHSDCPMAQTQWHIYGLNCTLHISVIFLHCTLHIFAIFL